MKEQEARKAAASSTAHREEERNDRKENWIHIGIIVKVVVHF